MWEYLLNTKCLGVPAFLQRIAGHTGLTDPRELGDLLSMGIAGGDLTTTLVGEGEDARLMVSNPADRPKGKTVSRLMRDRDTFVLRSKKPKGMLLDTEIPEVTRRTMNWCSGTWYRPNALVLSTMKTLMDADYFNSPKHDRMELLMLSEFDNFGTDPYLLPMFPDGRWRLYTDSNGVASYQLGDWHRAICDYAATFKCGDEDIHYALTLIDDEYGVCEDNYLSILSDPAAFVRNHRDFGIAKKPACSLRAAEAIREMIEEGTTSYILQQDQTNSGAALYSWFNGDVNLARLTNFVLSKTKQCLYTAAAQMVSALADAGRVSAAAKAHAAFFARGTGKTCIVPMVYGAASESTMKGLILDDPQKPSAPTFLDLKQDYIPGSLDNLRTDQFNSTHLEFWKDIGWKEAVKVGLDVASAYELAVYGSEQQGIDGLTSRLRPTMQALKDAAQNAEDKGRTCSFQSPSGCPVNNYKVLVDGEADSVPVEYYIGGKRHRAFMLPMETVSSVSATPPNAIHCVDGSVVHFVGPMCQRYGMPFSPIHDSFGTAVPFARRMKSLVRSAIMMIPQDWLDREILSPNGVETLAERGWQPLDKNQFKKAEHFLG